MDAASRAWQDLKTSGLASRLALPALGLTLTFGLICKRWADCTGVAHYTPIIAYFSQFGRNKSWWK